MKNLSVVWKLWLAFSLLILVIMVPLELALGQLLTDFYNKQVTEPLLYHSEQLAELLSADPGFVADAALMGRMVGGQVLVLDKTGTPVPFEGASTIAPPHEAVVAAQNGTVYTGQLQLGNWGNYLVTAVPVTYHLGAVVLLAPAAPVQQSLDLARRYLWLTAVISLALGAALSFFLTRRLMRPVLGIERATREIASGDFSTRIPVKSGDEIGQLAAAVNTMTAQLQGYEQRRREFLANVAHELRTPLSYIRGYSQALAEGLVTDAAEQGRYLAVVQEESTRLGRLVSDLMDIAQMDEGQLSLDIQPLDLHLPIEQAAAAVSPLAGERQVELLLLLPPYLPETMADGGRIQQVVVNLLDNALRHTPAGGRISVSADAGPEGITVAVADTGSGIHPDQAPLIFERFHKQNSTGRGLGLAIVRSIVRAHGGEVGVDSQLDKGSTFWFRLPKRGNAGGAAE